MTDRDIKPWTHNADSVAAGSGLQISHADLAKAHSSNPQVVKHDRSSAEVASTCRGFLCGSFSAGIIAARMCEQIRKHNAGASVDLPEMSARLKILNDYLTWAGRQVTMTEYTEIATRYFMTTEETRRHGYVQNPHQEHVQTPQESLRQLMPKTTSDQKTPPKANYISAAAWCLRPNMEWALVKADSAPRQPVSSSAITTTSVSSCTSFEPATSSFSTPLTFGHDDHRTSARKLCFDQC